VKLRRAHWWILVGVAVLVVPSLCCGGCFVVSRRSTADCERLAETAPKTVRTDTRPIRAELAPLGAVSEVHWILYPNRHCDDLLPVPGTERDSQTGVIRVGAANARQLVGRYTDWETVDSEEIASFSSDALLSSYIPSGRTWHRSAKLNAQFVGEHDAEDAEYYVDIQDGVVLFRSDADHFRGG
jgi:hypothetical protein